MGFKKKYPVSIFTGQHAPLSQDATPNSWVGPFSDGEYIYSVGGSPRYEGGRQRIQVAKSNRPYVDFSFEVLDDGNAPEVTAADGDNGANCIWCVKDGTDLHIVYYEDDAQTGGGIFYNLFDMSTDTWSITEESVIDPTLATTDFETVSVNIRSDGDVIIFYQSNVETIMTTDYRRARIARRESASWTTEISASGVGKVEEHEDAGSITRGDLTNDRMHIFQKTFVGFGNNPVKYTTYLNDNSFGHQGTSITGWTGENSTNRRVFPGQGASWNDSGTVKCRTLHVANTTNIVVFGFNDADSPSASVVASELGDPFSADQVAGPFTVTFGIDTVDQVQILVGVDNFPPSPLAGNYYFINKSGKNSDTWETLTSSDGTDFDRVGTTCEMISGNVFDRNGLRVFGFTTQQDQLTFTNKPGPYFFNAHELGKSLVPKFLPMKHIIVR